MSAQPEDDVERKTLEVLDLIQGWSLPDLKVRYDCMRTDMDAKIARLREELPVAWCNLADLESGLKLASAIVERTSIFLDCTLLAESVAIFRELLAANVRISDADPLYSDILDGLATALSAQFAQNTQQETIQESIQLHLQSLHIRRRLSLATFPALYGLAVSMRMQVTSCEKSSADYLPVLEYLREALQCLSDKDPRRSACQSDIARILRSVGTKLETLESLRLALQASCHDPLMAGLTATRILVGAKVEYCSRPAANVNTSALECIAKIHDLAVHVHHPFHLEPRISLSVRLFQHMASLDPGCNPQAVVDFSRDCFDICPRDGLLFTAAATGYSASLGVAYVTTKQVKYLDMHITLHRGILGSTSRHLVSRQILHNHASSLWNRFMLNGLISDLQEALYYSHQCLALVTKPCVDDLNTMQLSVGLHVQCYKLLSTSSDLDIALDISEDVMQTAPTGFWILGISATIEALQLKYKQTHELVYLQKAILIARHELDKRRQDEEVDILGHLGRSLRLLGEHMQDTSRLDEACTIHQNIIDCHSMAHAQYSDWLQDLALDYTSLWKLTGDGEYLQSCNVLHSRAIDHCRMSYMRLQLAIEWSNAVKGDDKSYTKALQVALHLIPWVVLFGNKPSEQLDVLRRAPGIARDAAMHEIMCSDANLAVESLEHGRAVFWTSMFISRPMHAPDNDLKRRLYKIHAQIDAGSPYGTQLMSHRERLGGLGRGFALHNVQSDIRFDVNDYNWIQKKKEKTRERLTQDLTALFEDTRSTDREESLLQSFKLTHLHAMASRGPIVVLVSDSASAAALLIRSSTSGIRHIPLVGITSVTLEDLAGSIHHQGQRINRSPAAHDDRALILKKHRRADNYNALLATLWVKIVQPVLDGLEIKPTDEDARPRLWWCPTGPFASLPLHAAGKYGIPHEQCTSDYIVSSYTPTITALLDAYKDAPTLPLGDTNTGVLLVAVAEAPGVQSLPYTSQEVAQVHKYVPHAVCLESSVSIQQVTNALPSASFLHLACHGKQDAQDPLKSGFVLHDGMLELSSLLNVQIRDPCFAFLSACESAMGDKKLPDEVIHFAAALFFMGYRSVVGTLWAMYDEDGPRVAAHVYGELVKNRERFDYDAVPRALDAAMREMRDSGLHPSRWATWVHIGI